MPAERIVLTAVMATRDDKIVWTGEYACSACDMRFRPDPVDVAKLSRDFATHRDRHA